jgi:hypothetical protein
MVALEEELRADAACVGDAVGRIDGTSGLLASMTFSSLP